MKTSILRWGATALLVLSAQPRAFADPVLEWNEVAIQAVAAARPSPPMSVRSLAVMHTAMFDALNAIEPRYRPFKFDGTAPPGASPEAAAAMAAHTTLAKLYPEQRAAFDTALAAALARVPEGAARDGGVGLGRAAAEKLLAWCADDGVGAPTQYRPVTTPGVYVMTTLPISEDIGRSRPWTMARSDQFRPGPPPGLKGEQWARDFNEIRTLGARTGSGRTEEQTKIAQFWTITGAPAYNGIIRQAVQNRKLDTLAAARLMALTYMTQTDAFVAVFDAKYAYNFWRPITAVRNGDQHDNFAIKRDPAWMPLVDAPLHPEYPCAHCISSASVIGVLQAELGDEVGPITMTSPGAPGFTRRWDRLSDIVTEVADARVWSGVHYRTSTLVAQDMGRRIAAQARQNYLQPK